MSQTTITDIGTVGIPVRDQDQALEFFTGTLGFEKRLDVRMGESFRWVTVAAPGASASVALIARPDTGADTGIRFLVPDAEQAGTSRVTWEIEPVGDSCRLTVVHDQLPSDAPPELYGGWPMILSGLKTWLETGQTLTTPGSLMYQQQ